MVLREKDRIFPTLCSGVSVPDMYCFFLLILLWFLGIYCASMAKFFSQVSTLGCRYLVFRCFFKFRMFDVLVLLFVWGFFFKFLLFSWYPTLSMHLLRELRRKTRSWFSLSGQKSEVFEEKAETLVLETADPQERESSVTGKQGENNWYVDGKDARAVHVEQKMAVSDGNSEGEEFDVDKELDVKKLRKMVKEQMQRANAACTELEKERMAAASAAEETMGMILRLQNEKSALEIQANHDRLLAEQKQEFHQATIQELQWNVNNQEYEKVLLEEQLRLCKQKLQQYVKGDA